MSQHPEDLFTDPDRTLDDCIPDCACGSRPRTRYKNNSVWIECKDDTCKKQSRAETQFQDALNDWNYQLERN